MIDFTEPLAPNYKIMQRAQHYRRYMALSDQRQHELLQSDESELFFFF